MCIRDRQYADDEKIKDIRRAGIKIFWAVENDFEEYKSKYLGDGVVSDWITEDEDVYKRQEQKEVLNMKIDPSEI